ncbi:phenylalanyl-tRNA synthetase beta chain [Pancytospora philotis]|nr:phenylalanyl-tRNA synthetase beta chain [Pancytospora philotis]
MPGLSVRKELVLDGLDGSVTEQQLEELIFDFGVELDDICEENGETMYKFDIGANRYDLLCAEGFVAALRAYTGLERYRDICVERGSTVVHKHATHERPHVACAVIRDVSFTKDSYDSFIAYQDKLHLSIGRNRSIVSMGTHDLASISGEISYQSVKLAEHRFRPLNAEHEIELAGLRESFSHDKKLSKYFDLLTDEARTVAFMSGSDIISVPPIINSDMTKISQQTRDIFVEVTGTDFAKVNTALKLMLYNFRGRRIESVTIKSDKETIETPVLCNRRYTVPVAHINKKLNLALSAADIQGLLERMMYDVEVRGDSLEVRCFDVRSDILHVCDIVEDVAVAYGFNNFERRLPALCAVGAEDPLNKFAGKLRNEFALMGFVELLTLTLLAHSENFIDTDKQVVIANPKSAECDVLRCSLLPGTLKAIAANMHAKIPIRAFEVSDVVQLSDGVMEGARNRRMLCGVIASNTSMLEELQGPLSFLITKKCGLGGLRYEHTERPWYLKNQAAVVKLGAETIGTIGVLHPQICKDFKIAYAASAFEIDVEKLFAAQSY